MDDILGLNNEVVRLKYNIVEFNEVTFDEYKVWFEKYKRNNDVNEIKFQNEIVKKFISTICTDLDIENSEKKGPETPKHDYLQYCGTYTDEQGDEKASTPDLVITKNWNWLNKENNVDYRAVVEVKSPYLQPIYNKDYEKYGEKLKNELRRHLSAKDNDKVILTDTLKWEFYKKNKEDNELVPIQTFRLYDLTDKKGNWDWKKGESDIKDNDVIKGTLGDSLQYTKEMKEFKELKSFLVEFLENGE
ncbi:hypothetical protein [Rossellomorea aquimaris]|uniref:Uncharacterized protein n=1 Tax=Rossellomorea aquimaris TaxID=189382 RepID=A0A5D4TQX4_9BACI|nr:hypothetical protein [Rossellomorea aquimaris]TYS76604.1 hypothetical protein FZC80_14975 [Rossellomorea aquimaris]